MIIKPHFVEKPWGGYYISKRFNIHPVQNIGEAFIVSTLLNNESHVNNMNLSRFLNVQIPYIVKVIDAADNLSIQVHPNNYWANILENSTGKTECWLVLDADEGAGVYLGFRSEFQFDDLISSINNLQDPSKCLNFIPVKKGDFICVPAGTIHAIGRGVKILEIQQASGITYRIWDWNRKGRELHIEKAKMVTIENTEPYVRSFELISDGETFFIHDDYEIKKESSSEIICRSNKVKVAVCLNVQSLKVTCRQD